MAMTSAQQQVNKLLQHFGKRVGADLSLQDGVCALYDNAGEQAAVVEAHGETDTVIIHCRMADFNTVDNLLLHRQMLMLNFEISAMRGTWLALDDDGHLRLCAAYFIEILTDNSFSDMLEGFINHAVEVKSFIAERLQDS
ncbi:type III secretion system chaperone [Pokkaliibacter sp. CJK22405]|uniref:type III secretion system chaperone n=1 Tax=Pokkaliibacter sp. CJK22405 TaxID=3384615 RepID=UPI003985459C